MATPNSLPSEQAAVLAAIDPDNYAAATYTSDEVDMGKFGSIQCILSCGTITATGVVDLKLQSSIATGGSLVDVTGKSITQLAGTTDSDKQAVINLRQEELTTTHRFVKAIMTVTTETADAGLVVLGHYPRFAPASDGDLASVAEIIT